MMNFHCSKEMSSTLLEKRNTNETVEMPGESTVESPPLVILKMDWKYSQI